MMHANMLAQSPFTVAVVYDEVIAKTIYMITASIYLVTQHGR